MVMISVEDRLHESDMLLIGHIQMMSLVDSLQPRYIRHTIDIDAPETGRQEAPNAVYHVSELISTSLSLHILHLGGGLYALLRPVILSRLFGPFIYPYQLQLVLRTTIHSHL